jgi:hypothetical protein
MISKGNSRTGFAVCLAMLLVFFLLLDIVNVACVPQVPESQSSVTQPTESQPPESPTPPASRPAKWSADGVITTGEYTNTKSFGDYEIHWTGDEQYIYIGMKAKTSGWLAVGIQPGITMKDADMVLGFVKDGKATVTDHFSTGSYGPHSPDTELGGTDDLLEFGGREEGGYTTIEFKRLLDTGDKYDLQVSRGTNKIIWSYGLDEQPTKKHVSRGYGEIDL